MSETVTVEFTHEEIITLGMVTALAKRMGLTEVAFEMVPENYGGGERGRVAMFGVAAKCFDAARKLESPDDRETALEAASYLARLDQERAALDGDAA